jgi:hypothetical protein
MAWVSQIPYGCLVNLLNRHTCMDWHMPHSGFELASWGPITIAYLVILTNVQQLDATSPCARTCTSSHVVLEKATPDL